MTRPKVPRLAQKEEIQPRAYSRRAVSITFGSATVNCVILAPSLAKAILTLGTPVEAYGKGGIVGEAGELEHVAACLHPKFGAPTRSAVGGVSILPSVKKRGAMGATLDIPVHHTKAMLVRSHFAAMDIRVPDAPASDELVLALAVSDGGRPHARVGGLKAEDAIGEDGLH